MNSVRLCVGRARGNGLVLGDSWLAIVCKAPRRPILRFGDPPLIPDRRDTVFWLSTVKIPCGAVEVVLQHPLWIEVPMLFSVVCRTRLQMVNSWFNRQFAPLKLGLSVIGILRPKPWIRMVPTRFVWTVLTWLLVWTWASVADRTASGQVLLARTVCTTLFVSCGGRPLTPFRMVSLYSRWNRSVGFLCGLGLMWTLLRYW